MAADAAPLALAFSPDALRPLVEQVIDLALARLAEANAALPDRLAYSESEAAALLGLAPHVLRDERRRGRIAASTVVGRRVRYVRADLMTYLMARRTKEGA